MTYGLNLLPSKHRQRLVESIEFSIERERGIEVIHIVEAQRSITHHLLSVLIPSLVNTLEVHTVSKVERSGQVNILK